MNRFIAPALLLLTLLACKPEAETVKGLKAGIWRAALIIQGQELPFTFEVTPDQRGGYDVYIINAEERLLLDDVTVRDDSVVMPLHIFDADIRARIEGDSLVGVFVKNFAQDYVLPFAAEYGQEDRFLSVAGAGPTKNFSGKYEVTFASHGKERKAIALFEQSGDIVTGTIMTPTGDYRYLAGRASGDSLKLSTFDGDNLYLFHAAAGEEGRLQGEFFSGKTRREAWWAVRNEKASLPDAESQTYLKEGFDRITFTFPDIDGKEVSLDDEKYRGKVVILQILGTWCPNCMDETRFLAPWYDQNRDRGVEIIGLAYENKDDFGYASRRVKKMMEKMNVHYDVLIAGSDDRDTRAASLPMLNDIIAFPTTIFIGKDGKVKKIHTGFNGPGTGKYYEEFVEDFNQTVNRLLNEELAAAR